MPKPTTDDVTREAEVERALVSIVMRDSDNVSDRSRAAVRTEAGPVVHRRVRRH